MVRDATTAELTSLINHPDIKPMMGLSEFSSVDMCNFYNQRNNVGLICPIGAMLFACRKPGEHEAPFLFLPKSDSRELMRNARRIHMEMFTTTKIVQFLTNTHCMLLSENTPTIWTYTHIKK